MDLSQLGINTNGAQNVTIPGLGSLQSMLGTIMTVSIVIGGLFIVLYLVNTVQRMRADSAMINMHKDIAAIRAILEHKYPATNTESPRQDHPNS